MKCRIIVYYLWQMLSGARELLFLVGLKLRLRLGRVQSHNILIVDCNPSTSSSKVFYERTSEAIDLIRITDPPRYVFVQTQIKVIVNVRIPVKASYHRNGHICTVDATKMPFDKYPEWCKKYYACTLIHEATHGRFCQKRIPCTKANRLRVENACVAASIRFAKKWIDDSFDWNKYLISEIPQSQQPVFAGERDQY
jgi:hypothetical protein